MNSNRKYLVLLRYLFLFVLFVPKPRLVGIPWLSGFIAVWNYAVQHYFRFVSWVFQPLPRQQAVSVPGLSTTKSLLS